jgi:hypothetical protein
MSRILSVLKLIYNFLLFIIFIKRLNRKSILAWKLESAFISDNTENKKKINKLLERYFEKIFFSLSKINFTEKNSIKDFLKSDVNYKLKSNSAYNLIYLENLVRYFQKFSNFTNYYIIRRYYLEKLIEFQNNTKFIYLKSLKACLELNKPELVSKFIKTKYYFQNRIIFNQQLSEIRNYSKFLQSNGKKKILKYNKIENKEYLNKISKSKVLVSGPRKSLKNLKGKQIFVLTNYLVNKNNNKIISYYNIGNGRYILKNYELFLIKNKKSNISEILNCLIYACFKGDELNKIMKKHFLKNIFFKNKRTYYTADSILLNNFGAFNVQNIIYDLLIYSPKKINVTQISFYLGKKLYDKNYVKLRNWLSSKKKKKILYDKKFMLTILRQHEVFSNFSFLRNLWCRKIFNVSSDVKKYIKLSELNYAIELDKKFSYKY